MSIYVGGEKAKFYKGDYGPAQFYKGDVKIAGYTDGEKVGTSISGVDTYNDALNLGIEGKSEQTVTANSPSPDYPAPIRSSEEFDVVSCGGNLCDNGEVPVADSRAYLVKILNIPSGLKTNVSYTLQLKVKFTAGKYIALYCDAGWKSLKHFISTGDWQSITTTIITPAIFQVSNAVFSLYNYPADSGASVASFEFGVVYEGTYTAETLPPYQPYHATTAHVPDPLRSVGDVHDTIEVSEGKVEVVRRVENRKLTASDIEIFNPDSYKNVTYFLISKTSDDINRGDYKNAIPLLCEFAQFSDYRPSGFDSNTQVDKMCTGGNIFYLVGFPHGTPETQGKAKLENTNYLYVLKTPTRTDIASTPLGQALLAMRTVPHYTQVYTNATLPPTLRARIKEMEM